MAIFKNGGHKPRTVTVLKLWDSILSNFLEKDKSNSGVFRQAPFYMDLRGLYSGEDRVTYLYTLDGYPPELEVSVRTLIRQECKADVRISFVTRFERYKIKWKSAQVRSKLNVWKSLDQNMEDVDEYNYHSNLGIMDSQERRKESLVYLNNAELKRSRRTFKVRSMMFISGVRGEDFDNTVSDVGILCEDLGITATRVMYNLKDYMEMFSPFSCRFNTEADKNVGYTILTDEIMSRLNTYSQGTIGIAGIYWGTDIYSGFPCLKAPRVSNVSVENWLITAESGGGKSFFLKGLILQVLADKRFRGTIMDIEGFEYIPIADYIGRHDEVVLLNMGEGTGAYFDPVEIVVLEDGKLYEDMYSISKSYTVAILRALLGKSADSEWVDISIKEAVSVTYRNAGVEYSDASTWGRSKGYTLHDVYKSFKSLEPRNDEHRIALDIANAKLERYFEEGGLESHQFKDRIVIEDIANAKLVVCSFGMAGKTEESVDPINMALMQLTASIISHLRSVFSKRDGLYNFKVWEEFQRWGKFKGSESTIGTSLTGGRKLGDVNIIITNEVSKLLADDRFSIFQNISTFAIGAIGDSDVRKNLCRKLSIPHMLPELDRIAQENTVRDTYVDGDNFLANKYKKAFLLGLDKTAYSIARMSIPKSYADTEIFLTGVSEKEV